MDHAHRNGKPRAEVRVEVVRERIENRRLRRLFLRTRRPGVGLDLFGLALVLAGVVVVVAAAHGEDVHGRIGAAYAVLPELFQFEALAVFAADVHQERVVGDAEYPGRLAGGHLLVPDVLEGLG